MKKIKNLIFILLVSVYLGNCSSVREGFLNDKKNGTDEFLVKKKKPLTMPPNFEKLPLPNTVLEENNNQNEEKTSLEEIFKSSKKDTKVDKSISKGNSIESLILEEIKK